VVKEEESRLDEKTKTTRGQGQKEEINIHYNLAQLLHGPCGEGALTPQSVPGPSVSGLCLTA
jgi:hypothetical protein